MFGSWKLGGKMRGKENKVKKFKEKKSEQK